MARNVLSHSITGSTEPMAARGRVASLGALRGIAARAIGRGRETNVETHLLKVLPGE